MGLKGGGVGSYCLIGIEFQFYKMKRVMGLYGGDNYTTMWMFPFFFFFLPYHTRHVGS